MYAAAVLLTQKPVAGDFPPRAAADALQSIDTILSASQIPVDSFFRHLVPLSVQPGSNPVSQPAVVLAGL